ncbi:MAG: glycosyltransferase family 4 protein, partial [Actinomycetota bacterium]
MTGGLDAERILMLGAESFDELPGGLNRYFAELMGSLAGRGLLVKGVVCGPDEPRLNIKGAGSFGRWLPLRLVAFKHAALKQGQGATLVDAHFALYSLPIFMTRLAGLPLVVHFQGPWAQESAAENHGILRIGAKKLAETAVYRRARHCIVLSTAFKRILIEDYRVPPWRISVIPPGVNLEQFSPGGKRASRDLLRIPQDTWVALAVRRLVPRTGVEVLLRAWAEFSRHTKTDSLLVIAGEGPQAAALKRLADELGISNHVRFVGRVAEDQLADYYRSANVSVVPSIGLEGFGLAALESLACGTPVIASDSGGLPEALGSMGEGLIVESNDAQALFKALQKAAEQPGALPGAAKCRTHAENFSWTGVA